MRERTKLENSVKAVNEIANDLSDNLELIQLGEAENDEDVIGEAERAIYALSDKVEAARIQTLLSGEVDSNDCYIEIHSGAGGTEAQDWAGMLLRMYSRWIDKHGYKLEWLEESVGDEAGIKSVTLRVNGTDSYGWLKTESGVHRLVRISPFDSPSYKLCFCLGLSCD